MHFLLSLPPIYTKRTSVTSSSDVTVICFYTLGRKKPLHTCSRVMPTCLCLCWHPWPVSLTPPCMNCSVSFVSHVWHLWLSPPGILVCPCTRVWNLVKTIAQNNVRLCRKIYGITKDHKAGKIAWNEHIQQLDANKNKLQSWTASIETGWVTHSKRLFNNLIEWRLD